MSLLSVPLTPPAHDKVLHLVLMHVSCSAVPSHTVCAPAVWRCLSQVLQRVCLALFKTYEGTIIASSHAAQLRKVLDTRAGVWVGSLSQPTQGTSTGAEQRTWCVVGLRLPQYVC